MTFADDNKAELNNALDAIDQGVILMSGMPKHLETIRSSVLTVGISNSNVDVFTGVNLTDVMDKDIDKWIGWFYALRVAIADYKDKL